MRQDTGFSLIELMVAVLVLSIAVIGLFRVFDQTTRTTGGMRDRALALIVAENRAAMISLGQDDLADGVRLGGVDWTVETLFTATSGGFEEVRIAVSPVAGGPQVQLTTYATRANR